MIPQGYVLPRKKFKTTITGNLYVCSDLIINFQIVSSSWVELGYAFIVTNSIVALVENVQPSVILG